MSLKQLSESTPVTIGLACGALVVAFWAGDKLGVMRADVDAVKANQASADVTIAQHDRQLTDHEARLTSQERLLQGRDVAAK